MASTSAPAVIERLIDDDYVHEQVGAAADRLRAAYRRSRALSRQEAVQDKRLYDHVREAIGALTAAVRRLAGQPEPEPPKRRGRKLAIVVIGIGVVALVRSMHRRQQQQPAAMP
jgi:hypothetical protein